MEEICLRLLANDVTLTTLYFDVSWPQNEWKRLFYDCLPQNETLQQIVVHNMQGIYRLPRDDDNNDDDDNGDDDDDDDDDDDGEDAFELEQVDDNNDDDDGDENTGGEDAFEFEEGEFGEFEEWEDLIVPKTDGDNISTTVITSRNNKLVSMTPVEKSVVVVQELFQALAHAVEHHPKLHSISLSRFDVVPSMMMMDVLVQAMKRKFFKTRQHHHHEDHQPFYFTMAFCGCHIWDHDGVIQDLLESNILTSFTFHDCTFWTNSKTGCSVGLLRNTSLKVFQFQSNIEPPPKYFIPHVVKWLENPQCNLEELDIRCQGREDDWWTLAKAFSTLSSTYSKKEFSSASIKLQRLKLGLYDQVTLPLIQAITIACCDFNLASCTKELDFSNCIFDVDALNLLTDVLARVPDVVDTLILSEMTLHDDGEEEEEEERVGPLLLKKIGAVLVRKLVIQGIGLHAHNFPGFLQGLAFNTSLEYLDLSSNPIGTQQVMALGRHLLSSTTGWGLKELYLEDVHAGDEAAEFMARQVLRQNTTLQVLSMDHFGATGLLEFARGIAHMPSLRKLTLGVSVTDYTTDVFTTLLQSLEANTTLMELELEGLKLDDKTTNKLAHVYVPQIKYWMTANKAGRCLLALPEEEVKLGLWLTVLAKSSQDADAIFFIIKENPRLWPYLLT